MDCASPRDPRNYLLLTSEKARTQWAIYDVTETREKYHCRPPSWAERQTSKLPVAIGAILYNICIFYMPKSLNIGRLTYDPRILEHWRLIPLLFLLGYIGIALWYNVKYKGSIPFGPEKTYLMKRVKKPNGKKTKLSQTTKGTICLVILLPMSIFIGIIGSNYALLLETTFLFPYVCLFQDLVDSLIYFLIINFKF